MPLLPSCPNLALPGRRIMDCLRSLCSRMPSRSKGAATTSVRSFSRTAPVLKRNKERKVDPRVTLIRYHMWHPLMPRPLRFGRERALRHWTIDRAWRVFQTNLRKKQQVELQRQYQSIQMTMEVLRNLDDGMTSYGKEGSRLYRLALEKRGVFGHGSIPIEYARLQTDTPGPVPWDHNWKR